jgi:hypothetical protein
MSMAEYPLRYSPAALKYLSQHADEINFVAGSLGISPLSVAAGILASKLWNPITMPMIQNG